MSSKKQSKQVMRSRWLTLVPGTLLNDLLRWLALVPGTLLFVLVGCFVIHLLAMLNFYFTPPDEPHFLGLVRFDNPAELEYSMYALFNPAILILSAVFIAPCKKLIVGYITAIICILSILTGYYFLLISDSANFTIGNLVVKFILNAISVVVALIIIRNKLEKLKV
jgi:hypothetical protein